MNPLRDLIEKRFMVPARRMKETQFEELPQAAGAVVFLGDSITEGGAWNEWFPGTRVANRGIDGDTTDGLLDRLSAAPRGEPSLTLLLIGTNDLGLKRPRERTLANVESIVRRIRGDGRGSERASRISTTSRRRSPPGTVPVPSTCGQPSAAVTARSDPSTPSTDFT